jgi:hypothetical protein
MIAVSLPLVLATLILGGIVIVSLVALGVIISRPERRRPVLPAPAPAAAKAAADCDISELPPPGAGAVTLDATVKGGTFTGSTINVPGGVRIELTRDLRLVADGDIVIDGIIGLPSPPASRTPSVNITIVSVNGTVRVGAGAAIGAGVAADGTSSVTGRNADAFAPSGANGGTVKIVGTNIDLRGNVLGNVGGGSRASATATGLVTLPIVGTSIPSGGRATAVSSAGGFGGDVLLCALESINIDGTVVGGDGGASAADATAANGSLAIAQAGAAGIAGDVILTGTDPNAPCQVSLNPGSELRGGSGGLAGVQAFGGDGAGLLGDGGQAVASGGPKRPPGMGAATPTGGTVRFVGCLVVTNRGIVRAGDGSAGGTAEATGGVGRDGRVFGGYAGGDAMATGGDGTPGGAIPSIPLIDGTVVAGTGGTGGSGGDATATPGDGGQPGTSFFGQGSAGSGQAKGGANAAGVPGATVATPPTPAFAPGAP